MDNQESKQGREGGDERKPAPIFASSQDGTKNIKVQEADFNSKEFKFLLAHKLGVPENAVKDILIPQPGETFIAFGLVWKVTYSRANPLRCSIEPCGVPYVEKQETRINEDIRS